jgi:L-asparagine permease
MSSLNSGLYSTGRVLRSLGLSKQAPSFTLRMSASGVPYAGILMTAVVYALGAILNAVDPGSAFDIALECASIGVLATWAAIFLCQIRLRQLSDHGVVPPSSFQAPGSPYTSIVGLTFIGLVLIGMGVSGWQSAPDFWHKTDFLVVVLGLPVIALVLTVGWRLARRRVLADTHGRLGSLWTLDGPRYADSGVPEGSPDR